MKAAILTIGDELLNGQTIDTNSAWIGQELSRVGVIVTSKMSVSDDSHTIQRAMDTLYKDAQLIIMTGGLGPTEDDVTKKSVAAYFKDTLVFSQVTYDRLEALFTTRGRSPLEVHRQQCMLPSSADLITNNRGTAPGMWIEQDGRYMLSMPGVPSEMKGIMTDEALARIAKLNPDHHINYQIIKTAGIGESMIAERITSILDSMPEHVSIAYLPGMASVKLRLTATGGDPAYLEKTNAEVADQIKEVLGTHVYGMGDTTLQQTVGELAVHTGLMIGTAESCTGGHIAQLLTSTPGSSRYYKGSVVAYANEIKTNILGVSEEDLAREGAVSEPVVRQMVKGLIAHLDVGIAVAVSGIAGPSGGSLEKPVGTIWMAVGDREQIKTRKLLLTKNRDLNIKYTAILALDMMRRFMLDSNNS